MLCKNVSKSKKSQWILSLSDLTLFRLYAVIYIGDALYKYDQTNIDDRS